MENLIKFKRDTSFRNDLFTPESFAHPAKMDSQLLIWIVEKFTKEGETILDPMFGSGTTMLACMLGRKVIGIELEQKFVDMAKANWEKVRQRPQLGYTMGGCQILQGDARNLSGLLADKVITSPPYSDSPVGGGLNYKPPREGHNDQHNRNPNAPHAKGAGKYDKIITSPPYAEAHDSKGLGVGDNDRADLRDYSYLKTDTEGQVGDLPYGEIDKIITSPPYGDAYSIKEGGQVNIEYVERRKEALRKQGRSKLADSLKVEEYSSRNPDNLGNLPYGSIDSVITSPPYEASVTGQSGIDTTKMTRGAEGNWKLRDLSKEPAWANGIFRPGGFQYSDSEENIGNLKSTSYLEAMAQVYSECFRVLKSQGLMILITKNLIRNQKEVRLDSDTIKLCEQAGFTLQERWYRELPAQSFWRVLYKKKFPDAPELKFEDVLIFRRLV